MRIEKDSLGEKEIPEGVYYGIHSQRSMENFDVAGERLDFQVIRGIVKLKWACALARRSRADHHNPDHLRRFVPVRSGHCAANP